MRRSCHDHSGRCPNVFVSQDFVGTQKIKALHFHASGKWSDAGDHTGALSTEIHCYQALGFCNVASAVQSGTAATVAFDTFNITRWDSQAMIAVDNSTLCTVNTLQADLVAKKITLSSTATGATQGPVCGVSHIPPAVLQ